MKLIYSKTAIDPQVKSFLSVHYNVFGSVSGDIEVVKMVCERPNNISSAKLKEMLDAGPAMAFLQRIAEKLLKGFYEALIPQYKKCEACAV
jgi:hypothetical protein